MSEARLELVEACPLHGGYDRHGMGNYNDPTAMCSGGSRRVLSVPTEEIPSEMIEAAAEGILDRMGMHEHTLNEWNKAIAFARAALTAAFNTLGIQ
jgi:hypothetical protein